MARTMPGFVAVRSTLAWFVTIPSGLPVRDTHFLRNSLPSAIPHHVILAHSCKNDAVRWAQSVNLNLQIFREKLRTLNLNQLR
jgi:hypothetical protein